MAGKPAFEHLLGGDLVGDLDHQPMPAQIRGRPRRAINIDVSLAREEHQVDPAEPDQFDVERGRPRQVDGNVGLMPRDVRRAHGAMEIDQNIRIRLLKFNQPGRQPKRAKAFGDGDPDFAGQGIGDGTAGTQQVE